MMLDKGQIKDWDGDPENKPDAPARGPVATALFESREAIVTGERVTLTPEQKQARKRRGQWIALALFAFVIIVFVLTMTKMGAQIMVRDI